MRLIELVVILTVGLTLATPAAEGQHATTGPAFHQAVTASVGLADPARFERLERPAEEADVYIDAPPVRPAGATATLTVGQRVDVRFNGTRLAVPRILEPILSGQIPTSLIGWTRAQIEQVLEG